MSSTAFHSFVYSINVAYEKKDEYKNLISFLNNCLNKCTFDKDNLFAYLTHLTKYHKWKKKDHKADFNFLEDLINKEIERKGLTYNEIDNLKQNADKKAPQPIIDIDKVLNAPNPIDEGKIINYIPFQKMIDNKVEDFIIKAWLNDENQLEFSLVNEYIALPRDTPMSFEIFEKIRTEGTIPNINIQNLYNQIYCEFTKYIYAPDLILKKMSLKVLTSYFYHIFRTVPYSDIYSAVFGSGKTTLMETTTTMSYHGIVIVKSTPAVIYRIMDSVYCTIGVDEIDNLDSNNDKDIIAIINSSNSKGRYIPRVDMENNGKIKYYDAFGIKYFTRVGPAPSQSWDSRSDPVIMTENKGRKELQKFEGPLQFQYIRDQCYLLRWQLSNKVKETYEQLLDSHILHDRNSDIYLPIVTIAKLINENLYEEIIQDASDQWKKNSLKSKDIYKEQLIALIYDKIDVWHGDVLLVDITNEYNNLLESLNLLGKDESGNLKKYASKRVKTLLESLGFERSTKKTDNKVNYDLRIENIMDKAYTFDKLTLENYQKYSNYRNLGYKEEKIINEIKNFTYTPQNDTLDNFDNSKPKVINNDLHYTSHKQDLIVELENIFHKEKKMLRYSELNHLLPSDSYFNDNGEEFKKMLISLVEEDTMREYKGKYGMTADIELSRYLINS